MNYNTHYHKMWPNKELWEIAFVDALPNRDRTRLKWAVEQQKKELINRSGPITVDVDAAFTAPTFRNREILVEQSDDQDLDEELKFLFELASLRDIKVADLAGQLPDAYIKPAYWLKDISVMHYGQDFVTTEDDYQNLYGLGVIANSTALPMYSNTLSAGTLRTWAEYVHNDDPIVQWTSVASDLLRRGFKARCEGGLVDTCNGANHRFGTGGIVSIVGLYGEALRRLAPVSFYEKWKLLRPRPEQYAYSKNQILPQVFPEGSPNHPSKRAMHMNAAQTLAYITAIIFDSCEDFIGRPLYEELQLEADNITCARETAGVHFQSDNRNKPSCRVMAEEICTEVYGERCRVPEKMMEIDFSV